MSFLLDYGFSEEELKEFTSNIPPLLLEHLLNYYKEAFIKFYDMFLIDKSNFMNIFNKYERKDLVGKINQNADIIEFL